MKKLLYIATIAVLVSGLVSCSQKESQDFTIEEKVNEFGLVKKTFKVPATKTNLAGDGLSLVWSSTDKINIFDETATCSSYASFDANAAGSSTTFSGYADVNASEFYALYPYNDEATWNYSTKTIKTYLSHKQTGALSGFTDGTNLAVAKASGSSLTFVNLGTLLRFTITASDITEIVIKANNSEKLAGDVSIVFDGSGNPSIDTDALGVSWSKVQLVPDGGGAFAPGTYNIVVLPFGLTDGLTVNVTKTDNKIYSKAKKTAATGSAGRVFELGALDSGLSFDRDKLSLNPSASGSMALLYTADQKTLIKGATGTSSLITARDLTIARGKGIKSYNIEAVTDVNKATTDPSIFYDNCANVALMTLNAFMYAMMGDGSLRTTIYGTYATPLLYDWADACKSVEYTTKETAGPFLARACFPFFVYYEFVRGTPFSTPAQDAVIDTWFRHIADVIKESQAYWQSNDYLDQQYFQNHALACDWGLLSIGYAIRDMSLVEYALDSIDNPRDIYDCLQGCILMAGDSPCARDLNGVAPQTGEMIDRYRHYTATNKGLQYSMLSLQILSSIARSLKNETGGGVNLFNYTCPTGENLELAFNFYAPFYASTPPDASLQGGYYSGESERIGLAGDLHGLFELGYNEYPSNTAIQGVISAIPNRASNTKASSIAYPNNAQVMQMHQQLGYTRYLSVDVDIAN